MGIAEKSPCACRQAFSLTKCNWQNFILAWRSKTSTFLRLIVSLFFIFLVFIVDAALSANASRGTRFQNLRTPDTDAVPAIPACTPKEGKDACYVFAYTPAPQEEFHPSSDNSASTNPEVMRVHKVHSL